MVYVLNWILCSYFPPLQSTSCQTCLVWPSSQSHHWGRSFWIRLAVQRVIRFSSVIVIVCVVSVCVCCETGHVRAHEGHMCLCNSPCVWCQDEGCPLLLVWLSLFQMFVLTLCVFMDPDVEFLRSVLPPATDPAFFQFLRGLDCSGVTLRSVPEGTVVFARVSRQG